MSIRLFGEETETRYLLAAMFTVLSAGFWDWSAWRGQIAFKVPEVYLVSLMWCLTLVLLLFLLASLHGNRLWRMRLHDPVSKEHQDYGHGDVSDEWLWYDLRLTAREEKRPLGDIIGIISMPDGRTAMDWVRERPRVLREFLSCRIREKTEAKHEDKTA